MKYLKNTREILKEKFDINLNELIPRAQKGLEDVENNHDRSWVRDLYEKNKYNLDKTAIFYRGTKITYEDLFINAEKYAARFEKMGVKEGTRVPMCMTDCPEFLYTIMGINLLGARMNCFGAFDKDYVTEIIDSCDTDFIVVTDDQYDTIKPSIDNSKIKNKLVFSLTDSLKNGEDPYIELDKDFYDFKNRVFEIKENNSNVIGKKEFEELTNNETIKKVTDYNVGRIDTEFLITYSSGSTNASRPKAIVHANRSLITIGRFQDHDMSDLPQMEDLIGEAMIPTHSNTGIISSISDVLYKGCTVALEPIYDAEFFLISMAINKPNYTVISRNMAITGAKKIYSDDNYKNFKMGYMMMLTVAGEGIQKGEEKFVNKMYKKAKCGIEKLPVPIAPVPISIGGGDCERGGMFFTPYRSLQDLLPKYKLTGTHIGLKPYEMVQISIMDENNNLVPDGQVGLMRVKTPTTMLRYDNNPEATKESYIRTEKGERWANNNVYAVREKFGTIEILERVGRELILEGGQKFPLFYIGKEVEKDTKHIMSYEVVNVDGKIVVHLELQPGMKNNIPKILMGIENRVKIKYGQEITDKIVYRIRTFEEGFYSTACGKRSYPLLVEEGITEKCIKPIQDTNEIKMILADEFFNGKPKVKML